jgi:hypothetical protein
MPPGGAVSSPPPKPPAAPPPGQDLYFLACQRSTGVYSVGDPDPVAGPFWPDPDQESSLPGPDPALVMYIYLPSIFLLKDVLNQFFEKLS